MEDKYAVIITYPYNRGTSVLERIDPSQVRNLQIQSTLSVLGKPMTVLRVNHAKREVHVAELTQ